MDEEKIIEQETETTAHDTETIVEDTKTIVQEPQAQIYESYSSRYNSYDYNTSYNASCNPPEPKKGGFGAFMKTVGFAICFGIVASTTFFVSMKLLKSSGIADFIFTPVSGGSSQTVPTIAVEDSAKGLVISSTQVTGEIEPDHNVVVEVVKKNMSCTVGINGTFVTVQNYFGQRKEYTTTGSGTGFIVGSNETDLLIATNNHVVEGAKTLHIVFSDDQQVDATVRATDPNYDLAIVSVPLDKISKETMDTITVATLGSSDDIQVGQMVVAIGNALGYGQSVTVGYLSAKDRAVTIDGNTKKLLQTDAAINGGNSGGPLFNINGEVIGINCAKYSDTSVEGMCFAIPISVALPILQDLMTKEVVTEAEQGYLGVSITTVPSSYIKVYGYPEGIYINSISPDGGAEKAGLLQSDIITAVNGNKVTTSEELKENINCFKYGTVVTVTYSRYDDKSGEWISHTVDVTLTKRPVE